MSDSLERRGRELALVQACGAGSPEAWVTFVACWRPFIIGVARRALGRELEPLAEDVASDVLAQLLARRRRTLHSFEGRSSLATWLAVLTRRAAFKVNRKPSSGRLPKPDLIAGGAKTPSTMARISENQAWVRSGMRRLPARDRLALEMFYEGGKSYKQVAFVLGIPESHVSSVMSRARARLVTLLHLRDPRPSNHCPIAQ